MGLLDTLKERAKGAAGAVAQRQDRLERAADAMGRAAGSFATATAKAIARILFALAAVGFVVHLLVGDRSEYIEEKNMAQVTALAADLAETNRRLAWALTEPDNGDGDPEGSRGR